MNNQSLMLPGREVPLNTDEMARLAALKNYAIMDSSTEKAFDDLVLIARNLLDVPMAYIALIDSERQWFKASYGLAMTETPRSISFCQHTIKADEVMVVLDTHEHPMFEDNPLVTGPPHIRFYAGAPIITPQGFAVGTLCLSDTKPHDSFHYEDALQALARQASTLLEARKALGMQEEAIRLAADQRDRLWDNSLDMMLITRPDGKLIAGNPAWEKMFGEVSQDGGKSIVDFLGPDETRSPTPMVNGQKDVQVERQMRAVDGRVVYTNWTLAREDDMIFGIARDITRAREAEARLAHAQRMESVGQLTGGIAHDFNNLLAIILGNLEMAERRLKRDQQKRAEQAIANAKNGAQRAASLTQRLLAFARRQPLSPKRVELAELIENLLPLAKQAIGERCRLDVYRDDDLPPLHIDAGQLENVILNLIVNARDAMDSQGELILSAKLWDIDKSQAAQIGPEAKPGRFIKLCVSDNGSGIPPELVEKIFEPFFTTKEAGRGTGLGLSQVHGFVRQSGGFVSLKTELGEGTTVSLWLPVLEEDTQQGVQKRARSSQGADLTILAGATVMLVEDEGDVRAHVSELLEEHGCHIVRHDSAKAAVTALSDGSDVPDIALSDVMMPDMDGYALAQWMQEHHPNVPVILMTGYTGGEIPRSSPHAALITKPFSSDDLVALLAKTLAE